MSEPRLRDPILLFLIAALFVAIALKVSFLPDWMRAFLVACAVIFGVAGAATALNWLSHMTSIRIKEINKARVEGSRALAFAIQGLTMQQTELVARHDIVAISGLIGNEGIEWTIRAPGGDIPWGFMSDFLDKSKETNPYLWPVRKHDELNWQNSEHLCSLATDLIKSQGWAERASGPYAARLTTDLGLVAGIFGMGNG
jgi:hypothetical protein